VTHDRIITEEARDPGTFSLGLKESEEMLG